MAYPQPQKRTDARTADLARPKQPFLVLAAFAVMLAVATGLLLRVDLAGTVLLGVLTAGTSFIAVGCLLEALQAGSGASMQPQVVRHTNSSAE